jgi:hypothetical protein
VIERAAALCFGCDPRTDEKRAALLGVCRRTLSRWKLRPDFQAAWQRERDAFSAELARKQQEEFERRYRELQSWSRLSRRRR